MATTPKRSLSVLKRARQADKRTARNRAVVSKVKTFTKKLLAAVEGTNKEEIESALKQAVKVISAASSKGVLHRNTSSRKISRLSKKASAALKSL